MRLPNGDYAIVDDRKLVAYCLSPIHPVGTHKARAFSARLGLVIDDAPLLRAALLDAAINTNASAGRLDAQGRRYVIDFGLVGPAGTAMIRSAWITRVGDDAPRLTTCYGLDG